VLASLSAEHQELQRPVVLQIRHLRSRNVFAGAVNAHDSHLAISIVVISAIVPLFFLVLLLLVWIAGGQFVHQQIPRRCPRASLPHELVVRREQPLANDPFSPEDDSVADVQLHVLALSAP
jgi:hypothetical protein